MSTMWRLRFACFGILAAQGVLMARVFAVRAAFTIDGLRARIFVE